MASEVEISNRALQKLGASLIASLSDNSVTARACNVAYSICRDRLFEDHPWSFALERAALAADSPAPTWGRSNSFQVPSNFIKLLEDYPEFGRGDRDWQIEGRKILTNDSAPLYVRYIKRMTDPNQMPPLFREALSTLMALELCEQLTQSNTKKESIANDYRDIISRARKSNAFQRPAGEAPQDEWIRVRV